MYLEEGGCRSGGSEQLSQSSVVTEMNLLILINRDKLEVIYENTITGLCSVPSEVTQARNKYFRECTVVNCFGFTYLCRLGGSSTIKPQK